MPKNQSKQLRCRLELYVKRRCYPLVCKFPSLGRTAF